MNRAIIIAICMLIGTMFSVPISVAQEHEAYSHYDEATFMDMDFEPNIATPEVPRENHLLITRYVKKIANSLKSRYTVDLMREGEVMVITIPTDELFLPNDTLLYSTSGPLLAGLEKVLADPYMWKLVIAMHTDDTGSEYYREFLSRNRLNSVYDWLMDRMDAGHLPEDLIVIPFSMASSEPVLPNDTRKNRSKNRRLELYFVPGPEMIEKASRHALF